MSRTMQPAPQSPSAKALRVWALVRKETRQLIRDPSAIAIGVVLPVVLIGSMVVTLLSAIVPISLLRRVQPAVILRGE